MDLDPRPVPRWLLITMLTILGLFLLAGCWACIPTRRGEAERGRRRYGPRPKTIDDEENQSAQQPLRAATPTVENAQQSQHEPLQKPERAHIAPNNEAPPAYQA